MAELRHIAITGASSGIGRALALAYAAPGIRLSLLGRDGARLADVAQLAGAKGAAVETLAAEVTDTAQMAEAIARCEAWAPIDLLIASAGISSGTLPDGTPESAAAAARVFAVNVQGTLNSVAPVLAAMRMRGKGQIALLGSLAGRQPLPFAPSYSASKVAIEFYGLSLRGALAPQGIKVSVITPGYVESPMSARIRGLRPFMISAERAAQLIQKGLARNQARIAFPWPLVFLTALAGWLPPGLREPATRLFAFRVDPF